MYPHSFILTNQISDLLGVEGGLDVGDGEARDGPALALQPPAEDEPPPLGGELLQAGWREGQPLSCPRHRCPPSGGQVVPGVQEDR